MEATFVPRWVILAKANRHNRSDLTIKTNSIQDLISYPRKLKQRGFKKVAIFPLDDKGGVVDKQIKRPDKLRV